MMKRSVIALLLLFPIAACGSDDTLPPGPIGSGSQTPDKVWQWVCRNLLAECGTADQSDANALNECRLDCQADLFSDEEVECLSALSCNEASDSCLAQW